MVSDALITHAEAPGVSILMGNETARIAEHSLARAVDPLRRRRPGEGGDGATPYAAAGGSGTAGAHGFATLQTHLVKHHALPPAVAADIVLASREREIMHLSLGATDAALRQMVTQMHCNGRLTPDLILRALCTGDIAFFETAIAVRGDVPVSNAQILIHDPSRRGLAALYREGGDAAGAVSGDPHRGGGGG